MGVMKICSVCGLPKVTTAFALNSTGKYGVAARCKRCVSDKHSAMMLDPAYRERQRTIASHHYRKNRKTRRSEARRYYHDNRQSRRRYATGYRKRKKKPYANAFKANREYRGRNPEKYKAHGLVSTALSRGKLKKKPCELCGSSNVEAHHNDYSKPLEVRWLCPKHHAIIHNGLKYGYRKIRRVS